jgi:hypothetical protein
MQHPEEILAGNVHLPSLQTGSDLDSVAFLRWLADVAAPATSRNIKAEPLTVPLDSVGILYMTVNNHLFWLGSWLAGAISYLVAARGYAVLGAVHVDASDADDGLACLELGSGIGGGGSSAERGEVGKQPKSDEGRLHGEDLMF